MIFNSDEFTRQLKAVTDISVERCKRWHGEEGLNDWSVLEWAGAMCGEAGEAANVAKKLLRVQSGMQFIGGVALTEDDISNLDGKLAQECADVFLYLVLLAAKRNINLGYAIRETFNRKSVEYNFPERL